MLGHSSPPEGFCELEFASFQYGAGFPRVAPNRLMTSIRRSHGSDDPKGLGHSVSGVKWCDEMERTPHRPMGYGILENPMLSPAECHLHQISRDTQRNTKCILHRTDPHKTFPLEGSVVPFNLRNSFEDFKHCASSNQALPSHVLPGTPPCLRRLSMPC